MEEELNRKKSILKMGAEKKASKRLSFASTYSTLQTSESPIVGTRRSIDEIVSTNMKNKLKDMEVTPQKQEQKLVGSTVSAGSQATSSTDNQSDFIETTAIATPTCKNIKRTPLGLCYVPEKMSRLPKIQYQKTIPMKDNQRNDFTAVRKSISATGPTANVLIIGDKILGEKIKTSLLNLQTLQLAPRSQGWNVTLNIMCENSPSIDIMPDVSFFIFLTSLDKLESLVHLSSVLSKVDKVGVHSKRKLVLSVSSAQGFHKNVIGIKEYENFLDCHQLIHLPWEEQGGPHEPQVINLLTLIYTSVGYYRGSSSTMKYVMLRGIKEYPEDNTMF